MVEVEKLSFHVAFDLTKIFEIIYEYNDLTNTN